MNKKESSKSPLHSFQEGDMLTLECVGDVEPKVSHLCGPPPLITGGNTDWTETLTRALSGNTGEPKRGKERVMKLNFSDVP